MRKPKVHYPRTASWGQNVMCGTSPALPMKDHITGYKNKITCKTCLRLAEKLHEELIENAGTDGEYGREGFYG